MSDRTRRGAAALAVNEEVEARQRAAARRTALVLVVIMLVVGVIAFYYMWSWRNSAASEIETINVLIMGVADRAEADGLDAIVVTSLHPRTKAVAALSLPAQTVLPWADSDFLANSSGAAPARLQDVYVSAGREGLAAAVQRLLGVPVHHVVRVDYSGFVELVDLLGGVTVDVPSEVMYRDGDGNVTFHLEPGPHRLDGRQALLYVRYKGTEEEGRRMERQRQFVENVIAELRSRLGWDNVQPLISIAFQHVSTDLDVIGATRLARAAFDAEWSDYALHLLPGEEGDDGWIVDPEQAASLTGELFYNPSWQAANR